MPKKIRAGLVINHSQEYIVKYSSYLIDLLNRENIDTWVDAKKNQGEATDFIIVLGGDGTILHAFKQYGPLDIPFLCINFGKIGFLSSVEPDHFPKNIQRLKKGTYFLVVRTMLELVIKRDSDAPLVCYALNEVAIRSDKLKVCHQLLSIDRQPWLFLEGDGIIASTSTGSTAYSWSAGGSLVEPNIDGIVLTPICSHNFRPGSLVLNSKRLITIQCNDSEVKSSITVDGIDRGSFSCGDQVDIRIAERKAKFITFEKERYLSLLCSIFKHQNMECMLKSSPLVLANIEG